VLVLPATSTSLTFQNISLWVERPHCPLCLLLSYLFMTYFHHKHQWLQAAVDKLYAFRDHYFENHAIDQAHQKLTDVEKELEKTMLILDRVSGRHSMCT